jgi:hypothetical protein
MVSYTEVRAANAQLKSSLPSGPVAVFVGGTSGIGAYTAQAFAKHTVSPQVYIIGRSQDSADRILADLTELNSSGTYAFIRADVSLIRNVDEVCQQINSKEESINFLCLSQGALVFDKKTSEGLNYAAALLYYSRTRFIQNLLPLLQRASGKVVSIFGAGLEGPILFDDMQLERMWFPVLGGPAHIAAMVTLSMEIFAREAEQVGFVHSYPGQVRSGIFRDGTMINVVCRNLLVVVGGLVYISDEESGERHVFEGTNSKFASAKQWKRGSTGEREVAMGSNGGLGSGVYNVDMKCDSVGMGTTKVLQKLRDEGAPKKLWEHTLAEFERITGETVVP